MNKLQRILESRKILVVDDEGFMRSVLTSIIKHIGCKNVYEAREGNEAWRMTEERDFDMVFCDWDMPGMNGLDLYKKMAEQGKLSDTGFVMVTGHAESEHVQEAIAAGVKEYVVKPFNEEIIRKKIILLLAK